MNATNVKEDGKKFVIFAHDYYGTNKHIFNGIANFIKDNRYPNTGMTLKRFGGLDFYGPYMGDNSEYGYNTWDEACKAIWDVCEKYVCDENEQVIYSENHPYVEYEDYYESVLPKYLSEDEINSDIELTDEQQEEVYDGYDELKEEFYKDQKKQVFINGIACVDNIVCWIEEIDEFDGRLTDNEVAYED